MIVPPTHKTRCRNKPQNFIDSLPIGLSRKCTYQGLRFADPPRFSAIDGNSKWRRNDLEVVLLSAVQSTHVKTTDFIHPDPHPELVDSIPSDNRISFKNFCVCFMCTRSHFFVRCHNGEFLKTGNTPDAVDKRERICTVPLQICWIPQILPRDLTQERGLFVSLNHFIVR